MSIATNLMIEKQDREEGWVLPAGGTDAGEAGDIARGPGFNLIQILSIIFHIFFQKIFYQ